MLTQDVVAPWFKRGLSSKARLFLTRIFIVAIGLFILVWGLWYPLGQDLWDYMAISGAIYSIGGFALLAFGLYWKRASRVGAYLALFTGFLAVFGLAGVQNVLNPLKRLWGFMEEVPLEEVTEKMVLVKDIVPGEPMVQVYKVVSSEIVGLTVLGAAIVLMVLGSLLFPDKRLNDYHSEREES